MVPDHHRSHTKISCFRQKAPKGLLRNCTYLFYFLPFPCLIFRLLFTSPYRLRFCTPQNSALLAMWVCRSIQFLEQLSDVFEIRQQQPPSMSFYSHKRLYCSLLSSLLVLSALVSLFIFYDLEAIIPKSIINGGTLSSDGAFPDRDYPPDYKNLRKWIHDLPQHNLSLPFPEGKDGRYVKFSCQVQQLGWNNLLNSVCVAFYLFSSLGIQFLTIVQVDE